MPAVIDLESITDNVYYNAMVAEIAGSLTAGSNPAKLAPTKVNTRSIARVAMCAVGGVKIDNRRYPVLGSEEWQGENPPSLEGFPETLPIGISLHADLLGHTEIHRGFRMGFRMCCVCDAEFIVRRGGKARWPSTCSPECKREWGRLRKAAQRAGS